MRFTSLIVELVRARPKLVAWLVTLIAATIWLIVPLILYSSPPGNVPDVLAFGREYVLGTDLGPPLAFLACDIAFRLAATIIGIYLCRSCASVLVLDAVSPRPADRRAAQAALAVLLTATVAAFSFPISVRSNVLAAPLWALVLERMAHHRAWQRDAWFALSAMNAGLLLLPRMRASLLLGLLVAFGLATPRGRGSLRWRTDPVFALVVVVVMLAPRSLSLAFGT